jgi:ankyrin repeat protein
MNGNTSRAIDMIQNHIGVNAVDEWGQTPIMIATIHKNLPLIAELMNTINPRVNLNIEKSSGFNVRMYFIFLLPFLYVTLV